MRGAVWLLLLAGCDFTFNLDYINPVDATAIDTSADTFNPDMCPIGYDVSLYPGSKFRIITATMKAWDASDDCTNDLDGATHLAAALTRDKLDVLIGALTVRMQAYWWIGAVQPTNVSLPIERWVWTTGEPVDPTMWDSPVEPNDGNGIEDDHRDQFAMIGMNKPGLADVNGDSLQLALCECDGRPLADDAKAAIDQSRF